jgi:hypothetical protein
MESKKGKRPGYALGDGVRLARASGGWHRKYQQASSIEFDVTLCLRFQIRSDFESGSNLI